MRLVTLDNIRYMLNCDQDYFESNLPQIKADIAAMRATQPTNIQKWYHRKNAWRINQIHDATVVIVQAPKPIKQPKKVTIPFERKTPTTILGIEYTDGATGTFVPGYWASYKGNGVKLGDIQNGKFNADLDVRWADQHELKGPWHNRITQSDPDGDVLSQAHYYSKCQGPEVKVFTTKIKIEQLEEVEYNEDTVITLVHHAERFWNIQTYNYYVGTYPNEIHYYNQIEYDNDIYWIKLNGNTVIGPFYSNTYTEDHFVVPGFGDATVNGIKIYSGDIITEVGAIAVDANTYLIGYSLYNQDNIYDTLIGPFTYPSSATYSYYGQLTYEARINCSGDDYLVRTENVDRLLYTYGYSPRCLRIFKKSDNNFLYTYSFTDLNPMDAEGEYFVRAPSCLYGCVEDGEDRHTDEVYEMTNFGDYVDDLNAMPGVIPDGFSSSILIRACRKTVLAEDPSFTYEVEE